MPAPHDGDDSGYIKVSISFIVKHERGIVAIQQSLWVLLVSDEERGNAIFFNKADFSFRFLKGSKGSDLTGPYLANAFYVLQPGHGGIKNRRSVSEMVNEYAGLYMANLGNGGKGYTV